MNFLMTKPLFDEETNFLITRGIQFSIFKRHSLKLTEFRLKLKMEDLPDELRELQEYAAREVLSNVQVAIAVARFHGQSTRRLYDHFRSQEPRRSPIVWFERPARGLGIPGTPAGLTATCLRLMKINSRSLFLTLVMR